MSSINNKRIAKNSIALYFRMLFSLTVSLYTSRVVLDVLGIEDFGIYNIVGGVVLVFSFLQSSLSGATSRFLTFEHGTGDKEKLRKTFGNALAAHLILAFVVVILAETIGLWFLSNELNIPVDRMFAAHIVFQISIANTVVSIAIIPFHASIIANEKMSIYAWISILQSSLNLLIVFILLFFSADKLILYAGLMLIVASFIAFFYIYYCRKFFSECKTKIQLDKNIVKPLFLFSAWDLYGNMSGVARGQGVNIIQNIFFGPLINAAGGIATQVQNVLENFANNFLLAVRPQITKSYASREIEEMIKLVINSSKFSFFLLLFISIPLIIENQYVLNLWLKEVPNYAVSFTQLAISFSLVVIIFRPIAFAIHATGKIKRMSFINGTIYLLVLPITYFMFKRGYSPIVPYVVNILLVSIASLINLFTLKSYIPIFSISEFTKKSFLTCILIGIGSSVLPILIYNSLESSWMRLIGVCVSSSISIFLLVYFWGIEEESRSFIKKKICLFFKKYL